MPHFPTFVYFFVYLTPLIVCSGSTNHNTPTADKFSQLKCSIHKLAYEYSLKLLPQRAPLLDVFDALELETQCGVKRPHPKPFPPPSYPIPPGSFFVSTTGSDSNPGTKSKPFKTIHHALLATRSTKAVKSIILREGTHFLTQTLQLQPQDSGLILSNYPTETAWISGGVPLKTDWKPYNVSKNANVWVTDIQEAAVNDEILGLMTLQPHERLTRCRYPNSDVNFRPFRKISGRDVVEWHPPPTILPAAEQIWINLTKTADFDSSTLWQFNAYANGYCKGGAGDPNCPCGVWTDVRHGVWSSESYWCSNRSAGGWSNEDRGNGYYNGPILPTGMTYNKSSLSRFSHYKNATGGILTAWRAQGWFNNMYEISSHDTQKGVFKWKKGGFQGGRGWQLDGKTGAIAPSPPFFIENVFEELDSPSEWFYDNTNKKLYLWYNGTGAPPLRLQFISTKLKRLIEIIGTADGNNGEYKDSEIVRNITIRGIGLRDSSYTYMSPWGVPSGGDWALHRGGAVFLEGVSGIRIQRCLFSRLDGNGLFLSGYTRNVTIDGNEFIWIGDSAIAAWGYTNQEDGTNGEQPRFTTVKNNVAHELGLFQLQSSMWFQARSCQNTIENNLFFNGPRAGINFNDGFGGGTRVSKNVIFNQCRESGDHGPINSWDRMMFKTDTRFGKGKPSYSPLPNEIDANLIIANYGGSQGVDNDDGSSWYSIHHNFFYGEGLKQDYGGHDSKFYNNINVVHKYDGQNCFNTGSFRNGYPPCVKKGPDGEMMIVNEANQCSHAHEFFNNTCMVMYPSHYGHAWGCNPHDIPGSLDAMPKLHNNEYYTPSGDAQLICGARNDLVSLQDLQKAGTEHGSSMQKLPPTQEIIAKAKTLLGLQ